MRLQVKSSSSRMEDFMKGEGWEYWVWFKRLMDLLRLLGDENWGWFFRDKAFILDCRD